MINHYIKQIYRLILFEQYRVVKQWGDDISISFGLTYTTKGNDYTYVASVWKPE